MTVTPESTIDRMVREAKSRLAVSIEANANYELIQMKKSWVSADDWTRNQRYLEYMRDRLTATAKSMTDYANALKKLKETQREVVERLRDVNMQKVQLNSTFGKLGSRHPLDHHGFISPVKEPTRSYKMPEKASKFGRWVDDTTTPGQKVWQDDRPDLATPHPLLESAQSYWQRLGQKLKLNSCY